MNFLVEGLQGSGKSTLVHKLSNVYKDYGVIQEGEYSPIELAWCAYLTEHEYQRVLENIQALLMLFKRRPIENMIILFYVIPKLEQAYLNFIEI